jgi:hypothetical protein
MTANELLQTFLGEVGALEPVRLGGSGKAAPGALAKERVAELHEKAVHQQRVNDRVLWAVLVGYAVLLVLVAWAVLIGTTPVRITALLGNGGSVALTLTQLRSLWSEQTKIRVIETILDRLPPEDAATTAIPLLRAIATAS